MKTPTSHTISCQILGVGAWGPGFNNWPELHSQIQTKENVCIEDLALYRKGPKPELIPPNERRRAPLAVRLAVNTSEEAVNAASLNPSEIASVFASGYSDTDVTDYMCRVLKTEQKQLSPTKFHNSVHNAPAGYWTISTHCMQPANSIAALDNTVSMAILEAVSQCHTEQRPILLTLYDTPVPQTLQSIMPNQDTFSVSIVLAPLKDQAATNKHHILKATSISQPCQWPHLSSNTKLQEVYKCNPAARILCFLASISESVKKGPENITMPINSSTSLHCEILPPLKD